jgi:hypothetical protein
MAAKLREVTFGDAFDRGAPRWAVFIAWRGGGLAGPSARAIGPQTALQIRDGAGRPAGRLSRRSHVHPPAHRDSKSPNSPFHRDRDGFVAKSKHCLTPGLTTSARLDNLRVHHSPASAYFLRKSPRLPAAARQAVFGWQGGLLGIGPRPARPARWPRWASPGRRAPLQPSRCGDFESIFFYRKMAIRVVGVAIRGALKLIALSPYRHIATNESTAVDAWVRVALCSPVGAWMSACGLWLASGCMDECVRPLARQWVHG